jgi:hypothetical protein
MGMDLLSEHGDQHCLQRAIEFGWTPEGTVAPKDFHGEWNADYFTNDYQTVTNRDALALGEALLRAIGAFSKYEQNEVQDLKKWTDEDERTYQLQGHYNLLHFVLKREWPNEEGEDLNSLRRLANYALKGGFLIA